ncbi:MAG: diguanylate cyclase [Pyrinomonadaceae bacterium]|nr:diguanylate cyclase [Pyrinomonadaceae bacterium]
MPVTNADGTCRSHKSIADAFVLLAAMLFGAPAATVLAAVDGFSSSLGEPDRRITIFSASSATVSTYIASSLYVWLTDVMVDASLTDNIQNAPLGMLLVPLCVMTLAQYFLSTFAAASLVAFGTGQVYPTLARESLVWTSLTQMAGASSAALFYAAWQGGSVTFLFVGILIIALVHLFYRFNERRADEIRRADSDSVRHIKEMSELHMNTIESLAIAIDAKDQTTHGHVRRTQIYAMELGRLLGATEDEMKALEAGALLHDVGKLAVPEYILNKPGKLTVAEFEKMKIHTNVGGDIIKRVNFPYPVEEIVRYHHEKWDGTGYPKGLKGEQIPMVARIIAVVDFYDATRCDRPYRKGMKREDSLALLRCMENSSFDAHVVETFINHIDKFDSLIAEHDIQEQVASKETPEMSDAAPDAGLASEVLGEMKDECGFRSIADAQREVFALHEIAQTIGASLNLQDTVTLVSSKLKAIVPFNTCVIYVVDEQSGKAHAAHSSGQYAEVFARRRVTLGEGITGWVIANARSMCNTPPELDLVGIPEEVADSIRGVLVSPIIREDGAFGAITLYATDRATYTTEHVRLLESVAQHAAVALNNALTFERTKESALTDPLTNLPNARSFRMSLEQRIAECERLNREPLAVLSLDVDYFKQINDAHGHGIGDRLLAGVAEIVKKQLRQMDVLARYAGDEFTAIMPMASFEVAQMVADRIRSAVENHKFMVRAGRAVQVGVSIGIACFPVDGETTEELLTAADRQMQRDKHERKLAPSIAAANPVTSIDAFR